MRAASLVRESAKALLALVLVAGLFGAWEKYETHKESQFCDALASSGTPELVLKNASQHQYPVYQTQNMIKVDSQRSPFGRFTCQLTFKNGKLIHHQVMASD